MTKDDKVIYSVEHHEWLILAGRWPSRHIPRRAWTGTIIETRDGLVKVDWKTVTLTHFEDNLELALPT